MPVLLTHPATAIARATAGLLLDDGAQVRLFGPDAPVELRSRGAFIATGDHDDHGRLEAALEQVHTMMHVAGSLLATDEAALAAAEEAARLALGAAERAGIERLVLVSVPGASPQADDPVRASAGRVEAMWEASSLPSVVVRPGVVDTAAMRDAVAALAQPPDDAVVAPVRLDDIAAALVAVDEARSTASSGHVVFGAPGPQPLTVAGWLEQVGVRTGGSTDFVGRVYRPAAASSPLMAALRGPWSDGANGVADLWDFAGITPRPVAP